MRKIALLALLVVAALTVLSPLTLASHSNGEQEKEESPAPARNPLKLGDERPGLAFHLLSGGENPTWKAMEGKVVVIDFWATWCPPCIESIPKLNELHKKFDKQSIAFFSVTYEPGAYVREFMKEHPIESEVGIDDSLTTFQNFQAWGIPTIFIFNRSGKLVASVHPKHLNADVLEAALRGEVPQVEQSVPWKDPAGAEKYFRKLQDELKEKYKQ